MRSFMCAGTLAVMACADKGTAGTDTDAGTDADTDDTDADTDDTDADTDTDTDTDSDPDTAPYTGSCTVPKPRLISARAGCCAQQEWAPDDEWETDVWISMVAGPPIAEEVVILNSSGTVVFVDYPGHYVADEQAYYVSTDEWLDFCGPDYIYQITVTDACKREVVIRVPVAYGAYC